MKVINTAKKRVVSLCSRCPPSGVREKDTSVERKAKKNHGLGGIEFKKGGEKK
jgi:hypothetical protein